MGQEENKIFQAENTYLNIALLSVLGDREEQQDQTGCILKEKDAFIVVCDGMGGHAEGGKASAVATNWMLNQYNLEYPWDEPTEEMVRAVCQADQEVVSMCDEDGNPIQAGTTLSAITIQDEALNWVSVGDSRIYLHRGNELIQITTDHIYRMVLDKAVEEQRISQEKYQEELPKGKRLVSFVGRGGIPFMDSNTKPFPLRSGDQILLLTDGLYKVLSDQKIKDLLSNNASLPVIIEEMEEKVKEEALKNRIKRDNMTVVLVEIKEDKGS